MTRSTDVDLSAGSARTIVVHAEALRAFVGDEILPAAAKLARVGYDLSDRQGVHITISGEPVVVPYEAVKAGLRPYRQHVPGPNVENVRSSEQAKRGVAPIPKRGK